jgi:hypothetical protein
MVRSPDRDGYDCDCSNLPSTYGLIFLLLFSPRYSLSTIPGAAGSCDVGALASSRLDRRTSPMRCIDTNTALRRKRDSIALTRGQNGAWSSKQIICYVIDSIRACLESDAKRQCNSAINK